MRVYLFLLMQIPFPTKTPSDFADALMRERDYFRAISEYKRLSYYSADEAVKNYCLSQIAKAYRKSSRPELAIEYAAELLMKPGIPPFVQQRANVEIGLSYLESNMPQLARTYFKAAAEMKDSTKFPQLCLALVELELRNFESAKGYLEEALRDQYNSSLREILQRILVEVREFETRPQKSPTIAAGLSFVLPGSGQWYSDHAYDAVQAFLYTGAMAFATYAMYRYEHEVKGQLLWTYAGISITGVFHAANVIGAQKTAEYRNWKLHRDFVREIRELVLPYEPA